MEAKRTQAIGGWGVLQTSPRNATYINFVCFVAQWGGIRCLHIPRTLSWDPCNKQNVYTNNKTLVSEEHNTFKEKNLLWVGEQSILSKFPDNIPDIIQTPYKTQHTWPVLLKQSLQLLPIHDSSNTHSVTSLVFLNVFSPFSFEAPRVTKPSVL